MGAGRQVGAAHDGRPRAPGECGPGRSPRSLRPGPAVLTGARRARPPGGGPAGGRGDDAHGPAPAAGVAREGERVEVEGGVRVARAVGDLVVGAVGFERVGEGQIETLLVALHQLRQQHRRRHGEAPVLRLLVLLQCPPGGRLRVGTRQVGVQGLAVGGEGGAVRAGERGPGKDQRSQVLGDARDQGQEGGRVPVVGAGRLAPLGAVAQRAAVDRHLGLGARLRQGHAEQGRAHPGGQPEVGEQGLRDAAGVARAPLEQALLIAHGPLQPRKVEGLPVGGGDRLAEILLVHGLGSGVHGPLAVRPLHRQRPGGECGDRVRSPVPAEPRTLGPRLS